MKHSNVIIFIFLLTPPLALASEKERFEKPAATVHEESAKPSAIRMLDRTGSGKILRLSKKQSSSDRKESIGPDVKTSDTATATAAGITQSTVEMTENNGCCNRNPCLILCGIVGCLSAGIITGLGFGIHYILSLDSSTPNPPSASCLNSTSGLTLNNECWRYSLIANPNNSSIAFCPLAPQITASNLVDRLETDIHHQFNLSMPTCVKVTPCRTGNTYCTNYTSNSTHTLSQVSSIKQRISTLKIKQMLKTKAAQQQFNQSMNKRGNRQKNS
jgi:hypothetical protein